ncbi:MAG: helix-turn-helix domain-containing protein [Halovenus sp.]
MHRRILVVACCLVVATVVPGVVLAGSETTGKGLASSVQGQELLQEDQPEPDNTVTRIELDADGSATWTLQFRTRLTTDEDTADYRRFQDSFRENTSRYLDPFRERMRGVVANADNATGRGMEVTDFEASTSIQEVPRRWGVVTYRFEWEGFAATPADRVVVGDVFVGGFFISDGDVLEVAPPEGYGVAEVTPPADERTENSVEWRGREDFPNRRPRVVVTTDTSPTDGGADGDQNGNGNGPGPFGGWFSLVAGGSILVAILVGLYLRRTREHDAAATTGAASGGREAGTAAARVESASDEPAVSELVTDEDRVRRLLAERGGRMKQSEIVDALGWSKSKTSRVLSEMADNGDVSKLRIGRENIIDLQDDE